MKKCFAFDPLDRNLEIEAYGEKFDIVANSAKNQQIIRDTADVLGSDKGAFDKVSAVCVAVDGILGAGFRTKFSVFLKMPAMMRSWRFTISL